MSAPARRPLDEAFVRNLRFRVTNSANLFQQSGSAAHWQGILDHFEGRSDFEISAYIARNFNTDQWRGDETWFQDGYTQHLFTGYDHTQFARSNIPPLDDEARSHYNPNNTLGRGTAFPSLAVLESGSAILNQRHFDALTPAQRQQYQLTGAFGGYRYQLAPDAGAGGAAGGGSSAAPVDNTAGTNAPQFDNTITDDPVGDNAGNQGAQQATQAGANTASVAPLPVQPGDNSVVQPTGQPGGTSGVPPGPAPPTMPMELPPAPVGTPGGPGPVGPGPGNNNVVQPTGQPGGTSGVPPGPAPPTMPTEVPPPPLGAPGGPGPVVPGPSDPIQFPDLGVQYPELPPIPHTPLVMPNAPTHTPFVWPNAPTHTPVAPGTGQAGGPSSGTAGSTPGTAGASSGTNQTTPATAGTTPGSGSKAPGAAPPQVGPVVPPAGPAIIPPAGPGIVPPAGPAFIPPAGPAIIPPAGPGFIPPAGPGVVPPAGPGIIPPAGPGIAAPVGPGIVPPAGPGAAPPAGPGVPPGGRPGGNIASIEDLGVPPMAPWNPNQAPPVPQAPGGIPSGPPGADGSVPNPLQPSASDGERSFTWRGQPQPPLAARLRAIMVFLDEGDVDREMQWSQQVTEIQEFLESLERGEGPEMGPESALLVQQALHKIQAHRLFEATHYGPNAPNRIITADTIPATEPRLKYNGKLPLILGRDRKDNERLQPEDFPTHPRAEMVVNDQWLTEIEKQAGLTEEKRADRQAGLSRDEEEWWRLGLNQLPAADNAALAQEQTFEQCIASDGVGFQGWVDTRLEGDRSLSRQIFNGDRLGDGKGCFARERAVRRAGLQAALRQFSSNENRVANTPWRRVRLPLTAEEVAIMRRNTGAGPGRKYELPRLQPHQLQQTDGKNDPQGFTANMAKFWADRTRDMVAAREAVVGRLGFGATTNPAPGQFGAGPPAVLPPMSLWGAYVDSGLSAENEYHRQMLKEMRTTRKLFERELKIAPRALLGYMNELYDRGFRDDDASYEVDGAQQRRYPQALDIRDQAWSNGQIVSRDLDKMEIYWIRFLFTQSITPEMTQELEPRAALFVLFADKLSRIFNDVSDPLFPDNNTRVSVEDLLDYIHDRADGPVQRVKFYAHDVQMWLERLHSQGRCRYREDWRCYGWVMRPIPTCHPEQLVRWTVPLNAWELRPNERAEDAVIAPRFDRLRSWKSLVRRDLQNGQLDQRVQDYFLVLAYRWGCYMKKLAGEGGLEEQWKAQAATPSIEMSRAINDYRNEFDRITQWNDAPNNPLVRLVKATLPGKANDNTLTAEQSLQLVRDNIIQEAVQNDSVLWPARSANNYLDPLDEKVRPKVWGWARPEVRGKVKRFFSVNRWPVQLQTERRQGIITRDEELDGDQLWDPTLEDPTPSKYYRPKARPYVDEKVRFKAGHRNFLIGDTPRQKQVVIDRMFAQMGRAMMRGNGQPPNDQDDGDEGGAPPGGANAGGANAGGANAGGANAGGANQDVEQPGFIERWSNYLLSRFEEEDPNRYEEPGSKLRKFAREDIPESEDPREKERQRKRAEAKRKADEAAQGEPGPKRARPNGAGENNGEAAGGQGGGEEAPGAGGIPPVEQPPNIAPGDVPGLVAARRAARGMEEADDDEEYDDEDEETTWWDYASMAMSI